MPSARSVAAISTKAAGLIEARTAGAKPLQESTIQEMTEPVHSIAFLILLIGGVVASAVMLRAVLDRTYVPSLVAFIVLGFLLRLADSQWDILNHDGEFAFEFLAELGVIALLFRVGLESDLAGLRRQLRHASVIWAGNVALSAALGYATMSWLLGFDMIPSLIAATALTATSIGVSVGMWRHHDALRTRNGETLTDVAEMDDLSAIVLMALLFSVLPVLRSGGWGDGKRQSGGEAGADQASGNAAAHSGGAASGADQAAGVSGTGGEGLVLELLSTGGIVGLKLIVFTALCYAFAQLVERRLTSTFKRLGTPPELMVLVAGIGILIAGLAAWLGFSVAVGALFAGLAFSRDPEAVRIDAGFRGVYHLLTPFFFIGIGLGLDVGAFGSALGTGAALAAIAIIGKALGAGLPALLMTGTAGATLIGVSMVPRAEITMIIMERGQQLGDWAVPPDLYAAFVLVSAVTCLLAPITLELLFRRWPKEIGTSDGRPKAAPGIDADHRLERPEIAAKGRSEGCPAQGARGRDKPSSEAGEEE